MPPNITYRHNNFNLLNLHLPGIHEYCSKCGALKVKKDAKVCPTVNCGNLFDDEKSKASLFVFGYIGSQMKIILERENNWNKVQEIHNKNKSDFITDITDGHEYRRLRENGGFLCLPSNNATHFLQMGFLYLSRLKFHSGLYIWLSMSFP